MEQERPYRIAAQGIEAWSRGDAVAAEGLLRAAIAEYRAGGEDPAFAQGRLGALLLAEGRADEGLAVLLTAIEAGTSIEAIWDDYLGALAGRPDALERVAALASLARVPEWVLPHIARAARALDRVPGEVPATDGPGWTVHDGEGYAACVWEWRADAPIDRLLLSGDHAHCLVGDPRTGLVATIDLETGAEAFRGPQSPYDGWHADAHGGLLAWRNPPRVGGGPARLAFLDAALQVVAESQVPDRVSEVATADGQWFVGCRDGRLYGFAAAGQLQWRWTLPGADDPVARPYLRPSPYHVVAGDGLVVVSHLGDVHAVSHDGATRWHVAVPTGGGAPTRAFSPLDPAHRNPYDVLRLAPGATDQEVRAAFRELALATHPDRQHGDTLAAEKFRAVQAAYEAILAGDTGGPSRPTAVERPAVVGALALAGRNVVACTSTGGLFVINDAGTLYRQHTLSRSAVVPLLGTDGTLVAAWSEGILSFFAQSSIVNAVELGEGPATLRLWGDDVVVAQDATLRVYDPAGGLLWLVHLAAPIVGIEARGSHLWCAAGSLLRFDRPPAG